MFLSRLLDYCARKREETAALGAYAVISQAELVSRGAAGGAPGPLSTHDGAFQ